jgi:hypothetical protein
LKHRALGNFLWNAGAATLMLWLPLFIFLKHHAYPLARPEIALCIVFVVAAGLFWGLVMSLGRVPGRIVVMAFLAILVVDIQTEWITTWGLRLLLNVLFFSTLFWFFRKRLSRIVVVLVGVMVLATLVAPSREQVRIAGPSLDEPAERPDLPFILHVILDEHIGIEGIPREFDANGDIAGEIRDSYLDKGFRVFGRAYSDYYHTSQTIPNLFNFTVSRNVTEYLPPPFFRGKLLKQNAWFDWLGSQGYRVHVFQPEYITYDRQRDPSMDRGVESSLTFASESIHPLASVAIPVADKSRFIMGSYLRLSYFLSMMRDGYGDLRRSPAGRILGLPAWDKSGRLLCVLSSMNAVRLLERDLEHAGPGKAFFVHLLLPHFPYAYDRDCGIRVMNDGWLNAADGSKAPRRNDAESRALRYPLYLDQLICTNNTFQKILEDLSGRTWWDDAIIVVHGDHGSRIDMGPPKVPTVEEMTDQDFLDAFSTLFAIKKPGLSAGYDRRQLPVGHLFKRLLKEGADPGDQGLERYPRVLVMDGSKPMVEVSLPFFDNGVPQKAADSGN